MDRCDHVFTRGDNAGATCDRPAGHAGDHATPATRRRVADAARAKRRAAGVPAWGSPGHLAKLTGRPPRAVAS